MRSRKNKPTETQDALIRILKAEMQLSNLEVAELFESNSSSIQRVISVCDRRDIRLSEFVLYMSKLPEKIRGRVLNKLKLRDQNEYWTKQGDKRAEKKVKEEFSLLVEQHMNQVESVEVISQDEYKKAKRGLIIKRGRS